MPRDGLRTAGREYEQTCHPQVWLEAPMSRTVAHRFMQYVSSHGFESTVADEPGTYGILRMNKGLSGETVMTTPGSPVAPL